MLRTTPQGIEIAPILAPNLLDAGPERHRDPVPAYADPDHWQVALRIAGHGHRIGDRWSNPEIEHALRNWTTQHGRPPHVREWHRASPENPNYTTVIDRYGTWRLGLKAAGLSLPSVRRHSMRKNGSFVSRPQVRGSIE